LRQYKIARKKRNFVPNEYDFLSLMKKNWKAFDLSSWTMNWKF
jgi:hypothetical protein